MKTANFHVQTMVEELKRLFDKYLVKIMEFVRINCNQLIPMAELNGVVSLCKLFDCLATPEKGVSHGLRIPKYFENSNNVLNHFTNCFFKKNC